MKRSRATTRCSSRCGPARLPTLAWLSMPITPGRTPLTTQLRSSTILRWTSNGNFGFGNPYNPAADKASSDNDIRHRLTLNYSWEIPWLRSLKGASGAAFGGWSLSGVLTAQTGGAFSVYENPGVFNDQCSASVANICFPVQQGALPPYGRQDSRGTKSDGPVWKPVRSPQSEFNANGPWHFCAGAPDPASALSSSTSTSPQGCSPAIRSGHPATGTSTPQF